MLPSAPFKLMQISITSVTLWAISACSGGSNVPPPPTTIVEAPQQDFGQAWPVLEIEVATARFDADKVAALEARMAQFVEEDTFKGVATLLVQDGEVVSYTKAGMANAETAAPIEDDAIYRIYSMTKPITGVALMQLWEQGKFSLDDPITKFLPELESLEVLVSREPGADATVPIKRPATMRELMSHTAGFSYGLWGDDVSNALMRENDFRGSTSIEDALEKLAGVPLLYQPGQDWFYSIAVDLQGFIVERLSGLSLGEYFQQNIFTPLDMKDTGFFVPPDKIDRLVEVYSPNPESGELIPSSQLESHNLIGSDFSKDQVTFEFGGHGLVSTMRDYARFCQMILDDGTLGDVRILKPETVALIRQNVLPEDVLMFDDGSGGTSASQGLGFGLNFRVVTDPSKSQIPFGMETISWGGLAGTWFWIDPENDLFFIGMVQRITTPQETRAVSAAMTYDALVD